ncbi:MAG: hypothetical protein ACLQDL_17175 [Spirochaetia bacterium]
MRGAEVKDANGMSWPIGYGSLVGQQEAFVAVEDAAVLRSLAAGGRPNRGSADEQAAKRQLWLAHNSLRATRPLIFCDPETAWYEIFPLDRLSCQGGLARIWEFKLRKEIFWAERIRDDRVIEPVFRVHRVYAESDRGRTARIIGGGDGGSYRWDANGCGVRVRPRDLRRHFGRAARRRVVVAAGHDERPGPPARPGTSPLRPLR